MLTIVETDRDQGDIVAILCGAMSKLEGLLVGIRVHLEVILLQGLLTMVEPGSTATRSLACRI